MKPVTVEMLDGLVAYYEQEHAPDSTPQQPKMAAKPSSGLFDQDRYLNHYNVEIKEIKDHGAARLFVLRTCLFDSSHSDGEAVIGQTAEGKLFVQCFHDSCKGKKWHDARQIISGTDKLGAFTPGYAETVRSSQVGQARDTQAESAACLTGACLLDSDFIALELPERRSFLHPWIKEQSIVMAQGRLLSGSRRRASSNIAPITSSGSRSTLAQTRLSAGLGRVDLSSSEQRPMISSAVRS